MTQALGLTHNITSSASHDLTDWSDRVSHMLLDGERVAIWGSDANVIDFINQLERGDHIPYIIDPAPDRHGQRLANSPHEIQPPDALVECGPIAPVCVLVIDAEQYEEAELTIASLGLNAKVMLVE